MSDNNKCTSVTIYRLNDPALRNETLSFVP